MRGRGRPGDGVPGRAGTRGAAPAEPGGPVVAGRYRLEERLGGWAGAVIWGAVDEALGSPVTVWVFPPGFGRAAAAQAACQLEDPRLARVFDADDHGGRLYVVTASRGLPADPMQASVARDEVTAAHPGPDQAGAG